MRLLTFVLALATLFSLGCSDGPTFSEDVTSIFVSSKKALEELETELKQGGYSQVSSIAYSDAAMFYTSSDGLGEHRSDAREWGSLFQSARVVEVTRSETGVGFLADYAQFGSVHSHGVVSYVHDETLQYEIDNALECSEEVTAMAEGDCVVDLGDNWYAFYTWIQLEQHSE